MKILTLSLLATLCSILSFGQNLSEPATVIEPQTSNPPSAMFLHSDHSQFASAEKTAYYTDFSAFARREGGDESAKCGKYHKMKTIGIILTAVGGGLLVTGIALEAVAVHDATAGYYNGYGTYVGGTTDAGLAVGGGVCIAFGVIGVGGGVPLLVIGSVKSHKYCGGGRSYMELSTKGNSLALKF